MLFEDVIVVAVEEDDGHLLRAGPSGSVPTETVLGGSVLMPVSFFALVSMGSLSSSPSLSSIRFTSSSVYSRPSAITGREKNL
jgi:hypothetical protein